MANGILSCDKCGAECSPLGYEVPVDVAERLKICPKFILGWWSLAIGFACRVC